jgi:hypothetical protein
METIRWEGQNFSEVVAPQEEEDKQISVILYATLNPVSRVYFKLSLIGLESNPSLCRGAGNTSVRAVRIRPRMGTDTSTSGVQVCHTQTRSKLRRLAQKLNHDVYNNNDEKTTVAEFWTLLHRVMKVPGSNPVPDPATRNATVYLIARQAKFCDGT